MPEGTIGRISSPEGLSLWVLSRSAALAEARLRRADGGLELRIVVAGRLHTRALFASDDAPGMVNEVARQRSELLRAGWKPVPS